MRSFNVLTRIGLGFNLVGVALLILFPATPHGEYLMTEAPADLAETLDDLRKQGWWVSGPVFLIIGFALQIIATYLRPSHR